MGIRRTMEWVSEPSDDFFQNESGVSGSMALPSGQHVFDVFKKIRKKNIFWNLEFGSKNKAPTLYTPTCIPGAHAAFYPPYLAPLSREISKETTTNASPSEGFKNTTQYTLKRKSTNILDHTRKKTEILQDETEKNYTKQKNRHHNTENIPNIKEQPCAIEKKNFFGIFLVDPRAASLHHLAQIFFGEAVGKSWT